jgi:hypothetical protein
MRRFVTALVLVMAAVSLIACSSGSSTTTTQTGTPVPAAGGSSLPAATTAPGGASGDVLSPLAVNSPDVFPTDAASVPAAVIDNLKAKKPMIVFWYDPTTDVSADQRTEIDAVLKKYAGSITLVTFDYTVGVPTGSTSTTLPTEIDKAERMTGLVKVTTTPYIVFVNSAGQITFRFSGFVDRGLIEREVMRATQ